MSFPSVYITSFNEETCLIFMILVTRNSAITSIQDLSCTRNDPFNPTFHSPKGVAEQLQLDQKTHWSKTTTWISMWAFQVSTHFILSWVKSCIICGSLTKNIIKNIVHWQSTTMISCPCEERIFSHNNKLNIPGVLENVSQIVSSRPPSL